MLCYENWHKTDGLQQNYSDFNCYGLDGGVKKDKNKNMFYSIVLKQCCAKMFNKMKFYRKLKNNLRNVKF